MSEPVITPRFDVKVSLRDIMQAWLDEDLDGLRCPYCDGLLIYEDFNECKTCDDHERCLREDRCKHQKPYGLVTVDGFSYYAHNECAEALTDERRKKLHEPSACYAMVFNDGRIQVRQWLRDITDELQELAVHAPYDDELRVLTKGLLLLMFEVPAAVWDCIPDGDGEFEW